MGQRPNPIGGWTRPALMIVRTSLGAHADPPNGPCERDSSPPVLCLAMNFIATEPAGYRADQPVAIVNLTAGDSSA